MDAVKVEIFHHIVEDFNKHFKKNITKEDIFMVAETQQTAITTAFEQGDNIRCMYLGTFTVQPNLIEFAELRRKFINAGFNASDAYHKAKEQLDTIMEGRYDEAVKGNTYGKSSKSNPVKEKGALQNKRVNKITNLPFNPNKHK